MAWVEVIGADGEMLGTKYIPGARFAEHPEGGLWLMGEVDVPVTRAGRVASINAVVAGARMDMAIVGQSGTKVRPDDVVHLRKIIFRMEPKGVPKDIRRPPPPDFIGLRHGGVAVRPPARELNYGYDRNDHRRPAAAPDATSPQTLIDRARFGVSMFAALMLIRLAGRAANLSGRIVTRATKRKAR